MNEEIKRSRRIISRRRALALGGTVGLSGVLVACAGNSGDSVTEAMAATSSGGTALDLLDRAPRCVLSKEETEGPYWFDVDSIRSDLREDRPGSTLTLALRAQDLGNCSIDGAAGAIENGVVEIWHCDAGGAYSGFESGGRQGERTDDGTYLRGAHTTGSDGVVQFTTIFPGWYRGRTTHIHVKVHIDNKTVLTTQLFFGEALIDEVYALSPYSEHAGRESNTTNAQDNIYDATGLVTVVKSRAGYLGAINLGVDV